MDCIVDGGKRWSEGNLSDWSLMSCLRRGYECLPLKPAVVTLRKSLTYSDAYNEAGMLAWYFRSTCAAESGCTIAISCPNYVRAPLVFAAAEACGARLALLPSKLTRDDYERIVSLVKPRLSILSSPAHCAMALEVAPDVRVLSLGCRCDGVACLDDIVRHAVFSEQMEFPDLSEDAEYLVFSSGSTGMPKAIVNASLSFAYNGIQLQSALSMTREDVTFLPVPLAHVFGVVGMYAVIGSMGTIATLEKYVPEEACSLIAGARCTLHLGVPTMFLRELRINHDNSWNFSSLRSGIVAGASCPDSVFEEFENRYGCRLMPSYGMSETSATLTVVDVLLPLNYRIRTDGRPIAGAQLRIKEDTGEVLCKSPSMMKGIIRSDGTFDTGVDADGWLHSGDIAELDGMGGIRISGRIKDMVIRGGINIFPAEIERIYTGHPDVVECCAIGYPDPELGERTALCVMLKDGTSVSSLDLRSYAKGRIEKCKIPDIVLKLDDLPRLPSGKIDKNELRKSVLATLRGIGALS